MKRLLPCVEIEPSVDSPNGPASVVWLHGLGASGHDFEPIVPMLGMEHARFVFPHAPERAVTINYGFVMPAWYDILSLDHTHPNRERAEDIEDAADLVVALVEREEERGVPSERIVLAGFSQGGAIALHVASRYPRPLAGILALSTYLVLPERLEAEAAPTNRRTPLLACHGTLDDVVPMERGRRAYDAMCALSDDREAEWREYPMHHEVRPRQIAEIGAWLRKRTPV